MTHKEFKEQYQLDLFCYIDSIPKEIKVTCRDKSNYDEITKIFITFNEEQWNSAIKGKVPKKFYEDVGVKLTKSLLSIEFSNLKESFEESQIKELLNI